MMMGDQIYIRSLSLLSYWPASHFVVGHALADSEIWKIKRESLWRVYTQAYDSHNSVGYRSLIPSLTLPVYNKYLVVLKLLTKLLIGNK